MTNKENDREQINSYFENYKIDENKPLNHKDIYAFLNKTNSYEDLKNLVNIHANKELDLKVYPVKSDVLEKIVYPIKEFDKEKEFKEGLNSIINNFKENKKSEAKADTPFKEVGQYYKEYELDSSKSLNHRDVFAYLIQYGEGGKEKLEEITSEILGENVQLPVDHKIPQKKEILNNIVYPIYNINSQKTFKYHIINSLESKKNQKEVVNEDKFLDKLENLLETDEKLTLEDIDTIISIENGRDLLEELGLSSTKGKEQLLDEINNNFELKEYLIQKIDSKNVNKGLKK